MSKKVLITQSNYIPWKGYFDAINTVDELVLYDEVQFTKRDWRNRNLIKTPQGRQWLSIPVEVKGKFFQKIKETKISDATWGRKHWASIRQNYTKAKHFKDFGEIFEDFYLNNSLLYLSEVNLQLIKIVCKILGISTKITFSDAYPVKRTGKNERLIDICKQLGAEVYYSGPMAQNYIDIAMFKSEGIAVEFLDYEGYPEYEQLYGAFVHQVSILDLLFNQGAQASKFMKSFRQ
ncbi:MAG: WbqC family protein [Raineya sp.]